MGPGEWLWDGSDACGSGWTLILRERKLAEDVSAALLLTTRIFSFSDLLLADHAYTKGPPWTNNLLDPRFLRDSRSLPIYSMSGRSNRLRAVNGV